MSTPVADAPKQGEPVWLEINTPDVEKAKAFYGGLFGWSFSGSDMGDFTYTMIHHHGKGIGGIMPMEGDAWKGVPPTDMPAGCFAVITDPAGAVFSLWKSK